MTKKFKPILPDEPEDETVKVATVPIGKKWSDYLEKQAGRLKTRKKRVLKPAPRGRAALVKRQKKERS